MKTNLPQDKLNSMGSKLLESNLSEGEQVLHTCVGQWGQAVVETTSKVLIIKTGFMSGQLLGGKVSSFAYANISSVEVQIGMIDCIFEIATGGVQGNERSVWNTGKNGALHAPNVVPFFRRDKDKFQMIATDIREHMQQSHTPAGASAAMDDVPTQIQKLSQLKEQGILTEAEFKAKKAELLARI